MDALLGAWRQGDLLWGIDLPMVTLAHPGLPISQPAKERLAEGDADGPFLDVLTNELGFAVLTQTCDIVRSVGKRAFLELAPLVEVDEQTFGNVERLRMPRYALHPKLAGRRLVVDLDRVIVVEKPLIAASPAAWESGELNDRQRRAFSAALAAKYRRFAFPNEFNVAVSKIVDQIRRKHEKDTPIGGFLAAVEEVRVFCPDWQSAEPKPVLIFLFSEEAAIPQDADDHLAYLKDRYVPTGSFQSLDVQAIGFDAMSAARYRQTDMIEFEDLSRGNAAND